MVIKSRASRNPNKTPRRPEKAKKKSTTTKSTTTKSTTTKRIPAKVGAKATTKSGDKVEVVKEVVETIRDTSRGIKYKKRTPAERKAEQDKKVRQSPLYQKTLVEKKELEREIQSLKEQSQSRTIRPVATRGENVAFTSQAPAQSSSVAQAEIKALTDQLKKTNERLKSLEKGQPKEEPKEEEPKEKPKSELQQTRDTILQEGIKRKIAQRDEIQRQKQLEEQQKRKEEKERIEQSRIRVATRTLRREKTAFQQAQEAREERERKIEEERKKEIRKQINIREQRLDEKERQERFEKSKRELEEISKREKQKAAKEEEVRPVEGFIRPQLSPQQVISEIEERDRQRREKQKLREERERKIEEERKKEIRKQINIREQRLDEKERQEISKREKQQQRQSHQQAQQEQTTSNRREPRPQPIPEPTPHDVEFEDVQEIPEIQLTETDRDRQIREEREILEQENQTPVLDLLQPQDDEDDKEFEDVSEFDPDKPPSTLLPQQPPQEKPPLVQETIRQFVDEVPEIPKDRPITQLELDTQDLIRRQSHQQAQQEQTTSNRQSDVRKSLDEKERQDREKEEIERQKKELEEKIGEIFKARQDKAASKIQSSVRGRQSRKRTDIKDVMGGIISGAYDRALNVREQREISRRGGNLIQRPQKTPEQEEKELQENIARRDNLIQEYNRVVIEEARSPPPVGGSGGSGGRSGRGGRSGVPSQQAIGTIIGDIPERPETILPPEPFRSIERGKYKGEIKIPKESEVLQIIKNYENNPQFTRSIEILKELLDKIKTINTRRKNKSVKKKK